MGKEVTFLKTRKSQETRITVAIRLFKKTCIEQQHLPALEQ